MNFTDTHAHLYAEEFDIYRVEMINRAKQQGLIRLLLPAIDSLYHAKMMDVVTAFPGLCHAMMGLHPTSVKADFRNELDIVEKHLSDPDHNFCAIGEMGLDFFWDKTFEKEQVKAFEYQLDLSLQYHLPLVIHTRNSMEETLKIIGKRNNPELRGVFHCFSGDTGQAQKAIDYGFMVGIGGVVTYKNSKLQKVVAEIPLESILLETDAPWLPPVPHRGQRNESSYIPLIAKKIAEIKQLPLEEVADLTTKNALSLFSV